MVTVDELNEVLHRRRFDKYMREDQRLEFLAALIREAELVEVTEVVTESRDPKDNKFLELAVGGKAAYIISGDNDLLVLHPFRGIPVVTPQTFLTQS
jgi:putative PIN family toxin of toxin-antitoxin system